MLAFGWFQLGKLVLVLLFWQEDRPVSKGFQLKIVYELAHLPIIYRSFGSVAFGGACFSPGVRVAFAWDDRLPGQRGGE